MVAEKYKKWAIEPAIVGTTVVVGAPLIGGVLNSVLSFIPSMMLGGISVPHGIIAAGAAAIVGNFIANMVSKKV